MSAVAGPRSPAGPPTDRSPYVGLTYYTENEADFFFGRDADASILIGNLRASRLTLLYAESGVGKSSVLRAAVAARLQELARRDAELRGTPRFVPVVFNVWSSEPVSGLVDAIEQALSPFRDEAERALPRDRLEDAVEAATAGGTSLLVILDQFEEHFVYGTAQNGREPFAQQLARCVNRADFRMNVLISIREDSYAGVGDLFSGLIPNLYANSVHLDYLDREGGREAILRPIEKLNEGRPKSEQLEMPESALVEAVLDGVRRRARERADVRDIAQVDGSGQQVERQETAPNQIETTYLQLVMTRLWGEETTRGLRLATLEELGGTDQIIDEHLDRALDALSPGEQDTAASIFTFLVTKAGTKIALTARDLSELSDLPESRIDPVLRSLAASESHILRPVELHDQGRGRAYEIFHDALARPIVEWRQAKLNARLAEAARREATARTRRLAIIVVIALVALAVMSGLFVWALSQRAEAREQAQLAEAGERAAKARQLEANAIVELGRDPELGLALAAHAARLSPAAATEDVLRRALRESRVLTVARLDSPVSDLAALNDRILAAVIDGGGVRLVDGNTVGRVVVAPRKGAQSWFSGEHVLTLRDGTLNARTLPEGRVVATVSVPEDTRYATANPGLSRFVVAGRRGAAVLDARGVVLAELPHPASVNRAVFSPNGRRIATAGSDGKAIVWELDGHRVRRFDSGAEQAYDVGFDHISRLLVVASSDGAARVWATPSGNREAVLSHAHEVRRARFGDTQDSVLTASRDGTARTWKVEASAPRAVFAGHDGPVQAAIFLPGDRIATGGNDGTVRTWETKLQPRLRRSRGTAAPEPTRDPRARIDGAVVRLDNGVELDGHRNQVTSVEYSPDGRRVVTASADGDARIWNAATGRRIAVLSGHGGKVFDASFSPDGKWVVTGGPATAGLWLAATGELWYFLRGDGSPVRAAEFASPTEIVTRGGDGVRAYECGICGGLASLVELAKTQLERTGRELTQRERLTYLGEP